MEYRIPFNRAAIVGDELRHLERVIASGHFSGDGPFTRRCSELLASALGVDCVMLTTSCTHALELCALLLDLTPEDEVIVPSYAFVSTASAFALRGARIIFADVRPDTLNLDETKLAGLVTPRTRAIVALHYAGVGCEMDVITEIARAGGFEVIEDNAHGLFGAWRGQPLGSIGSLATQSFHETKNFSCGEGGALVVNRSEWVERAEILREKGTNRRRFFRGQVDRYTWVDLGSSYLPAELLAAFLFGQLEARERVQARRAAIWVRYRAELADWAAQHGVGLPQPPPYCEHPHHLFHLMLPTESARQRLIEHLAARGILAVFHYQPLHLSEVGRRFGGRPGDCPVAESASERLLRLPLFYSLGASEQDEIIEAVRDFTPS